jgi:DNA primase
MKKAFDKEQLARIERVKKFANVRLVLDNLNIKFEERKQNDLWFKCPIPIHKEKDASTHICSDPTDSNHALWNCFGCNESGDVIHLVQLMTQLSFWECIQWLESRLGDEDVYRLDKPKVYPKLPKHFEKPDKASDWHPAYMKYMIGRGIQWHQIVRHKIGYCDQGKYRWRIIVPVMLGFKFCTWIGRAIIGRRRITSCDGGLVGLFGSELAKPKDGPAILVEGWTDALRLERMGYANVMALQTNMLQDVQFEFLKKFPYIIVMPDNDGGGDFLNNMLAPYIEQHEFYMAYLEEDKADPDSAQDDDIINAFDNLVEWEPKIMIPEIEIIL